MEDEEERRPRVILWNLIPFEFIWMFEQHVITLITNMKENVLVARITLRNIGTKLG